jgi:hypothetical protein
MLVSFLAMALCVGATAGFRRYTLVLLVVVMGIVTVAGAIGAELVISRVEDLVSSRSVSWADRLDMARSALAIVGAFPLFGAGLGSFRFVFERFQSNRYGDRIVDYLHNDWLQAFSETGLIGGFALAVGMALLLGTAIRRALRREDAFCRWTALGAAVGAGAMLLHSLSDYNLSKITSNAVVFAALMGLSYAASGMSSQQSESAGHRYPAFDLEADFAAAWAAWRGQRPLERRTVADLAALCQRFEEHCAAEFGPEGARHWPALRLEACDLAACDLAKRLIRFSLVMTHCTFVGKVSLAGTTFAAWCDFSVATFAAVRSLRSGVEERVDAAGFMEGAAVGQAD